MKQTPNEEVFVNSEARIKFFPQNQALFWPTAKSVWYLIALHHNFIIQIKLNCYTLSLFPTVDGITESERTVLNSVRVQGPVVQN